MTHATDPDQDKLYVRSVVGDGSRTSSTIPKTIPSSPTSFVKHDDGKLRFDLVPARALAAWAQVLAHGAVKYDDHNWRKGTKWSRYFAASQRHLWAWWAGETHDPETGENHLAHAMCNLGFLLEFQDTHPELDDRPEGAPWAPSSEIVSDES